jgi:glycosyltransferase involved in cell wall biosynthesis
MTGSSRDRNVIAASSLFDAAWYLSRNADVAAAGIDPVRHYIDYGASEGRDPGPGFSSSAYLAAYPDVKRAGTNPLLHYLEYGLAEGRAIRPSSAVATDACGRVLVLDDHVPYPELGVGYPRARTLLRGLVALDWLVTFVPLECPTDDPHQLRRVVPPEIEVALGISPSDLLSFLAARAGSFDLILVSRPNNMRTLSRALEHAPAVMRQVPILYDAEALWSLREARRCQVEGAPLCDADRERLLDEEVGLARAASHVTAVSEQEAAVFRSRGCRSVSVLSQGYALSPTPRAHAARKDLLFVGALDEDRSPNADALMWFVREVFPIVTRSLSVSVRLIVAGRCAAPQVRALAGLDTILLGQVADLTPLYDQARVFIAPHRYAGGIPTKILEAAAHGLPCVASELLAEQLGWRHGIEILSAGSASEFGRRVVELYSDERLWIDVRRAALGEIERKHTEPSFQEALAAALRDVMRSTGTARHDRDARRIATCPLFDPEWYLAVNDDVAKSGMDAATHYLLFGANEGRDPGPRFSTLGYRSRYADVSTSGINPLLHYMDIGAREQRQIGGGEVERRVVRVVCICGEPGSVAVRYRVEQLVSALNASGTESVWMTIEEALGQADVVPAAAILILWRTAWDESVANIVRRARMSGAVVLFDADDLVTEPYLARTDIIDGIRTQDLSESEVETYYRRTLTAFDSSDWACCSTPELAAVFRTRGKPTFVIPNGFTDATHSRARLAVRRRRAQLERDGLVRIGYAAGTRSHQRDFAQAADAVASVLRDHPQCRLVLFREPESGRPLVDPTEFAALQDLEAQIEWRPFVPDDEWPDELARFDINLAPLVVDNPFCESKSELKFVEAALVEVCTVASPTGPYRRAIAHDQTGFLAEGSSCWNSILRRLVRDRTLRQQVGRAAYREVLWKHGERCRQEMASAMLDQILGDARVAARAGLSMIVRHHDVRPCVLPRTSELVYESDSLGAADVTVVMPLHNYSRYVVTALESVAAQTLSVLDLIVVDDASTDDSLAIAGEWIRRHAARFNRVALYHNVANAGLSPTRNAAIDLAETPFVFPLDPDDRLLPDACEQLLDAIRQDGAAFVYPLLRQFGDTDAVMGKTPYTPQALAGGNFIDAMAMIRKDCWAAVGGYTDHRPQGWEDFDFWCRIAEQGLWGRQLPVILAECRQHGGSMQRTEMSLPRNKQELIALMHDFHPWVSLAESFSHVRTMTRHATDRYPLFSGVLPDRSQAV